MTKRSILVGLAALALALATSCTSPTKGKTEDQLIAQLASPNEKVVWDSLAALEENYLTSTTWHPAVRNLLADPREEVRLKAARVLGVVHAEATPEDLKNIAGMFQSTTPNIVMGALKALRGLQAQSTLPEIVPLLQNSHDGIVRDALRTIAVLGDKSLLPQVEPLLNHPSSKVQKDAMACVAALKARS